MSPLKIVVYSVATLALAVVGLGMVRPPVNAAAPQTVEPVVIAREIERFDDPDRGVSCYLYRGTRIACVVTETLPAEGDQ